jgi:trehalose 6-phosphate synthase
MNLVAKEFVAARHDAQGVLVLSEFAGAAFELSEALIVNPYHLDQVSNAILQGIEMQPTEQALRMQRMRALVRESNVYRWAGRMLADGLRFEHYGGNRSSGLANACQSTAAMAMCA